MKFIIIAAIACTILAIGIDLFTWQQVATNSTTDIDIWIQWSAYIRFIRTMLFACIIIPYLQIGKLSKDQILMISAMVIATVADFYLILQNRLIIGIGIFAIMQLILLYRHFQGFHWGIFHHKFYLYLTIGLFAFAIIILYFLYTPLHEKGLFWPVTGYGFLLILSVLAAAYSKSTGVLSNKQATFAFIGMILFLICDITVGLGAVWSNQPAGYLVRALTGIAYTPALIFLSLSAMKK